MRIWVGWVGVAALVLSGCGDGEGDDGRSDAESAGGDASMDPSDGGVSRDAGGSDGADAGDPAVDGGTGGDAGSGATGGEAFRGEVLVFEDFEDGAFGDRGWYDGPSATLSDTEHVEGSTRSFECRFEPGERGCSGGTPGRIQFATTESVYLSFWLKLGDTWMGSGRPYHPHLLHFTTDADDRYVGPARTHLTAYIEMLDRTPQLALQDSRNVDTSCILRNDDSFVGCDGDFDTYVFGEDRSVCACNGLVGDVDGRDCFPTGGGNWYSSRTWRADAPAFERGRWHFVEAYFEMNGVVDGAGVPDGRIRYWVDGVAVVSSDDILLRTGALPDLAFEQFIVAPYIGDGSPVDQRLWIDDLTIARGR